MHEGPPPKEIYPQLEALIKKVEAEIARGRVPSPFNDMLREIDGFFLLAIGKLRLSIVNLQAATGFVLVWNVLITIAIGVLIWDAFIR